MVKARLSSPELLYSWPLKPYLLRACLRLRTFPNGSTAAYRGSTLMFLSSAPVKLALLSASWEMILLTGGLLCPGFAGLYTAGAIRGLARCCSSRPDVSMCSWKKGRQHPFSVVQIEKRQFFSWRRLILFVLEHFPHFRPPSCAVRRTEA